MTDEDDAVTIALDWALRDIAQLSHKLADPGEAWQRWWMWFVASVAAKGLELDTLEARMLEVSIRVRNELLAAV